MPAIKTIHTKLEWAKFHETLAKMYERLAKESRDDNSKKHWRDKANECWGKARELKD